jgi:tetratricopeptide (TPR) repeat protein
MMRHLIGLAAMLLTAVIHLGCAGDARNGANGTQRGKVAYKKGIAAQKKLDFVKGVQLFSDAIQEDPENAEAYFRRGVCLAMQQRNDEALKDLNQAIELKPDFAEAYSKRGTILCDLEQNDEGQADFEKALALDPAQADAQYLLGLILFAIRNDPAAALPHLDRAAELRPKNGEIYKARALVHKQLGNLTKAQEDTSRARSLGAIPRR